MLAGVLSVESLTGYRISSYFTRKCREYNIGIGEILGIGIGIGQKNGIGTPLVNISPTLVINTSIERSSRVLHYGNPKM